MPALGALPVFCRIKHYEGKLATLTAINGMLQSENDQLKASLEEAQNPTTDAGNSPSSRRPAAVPR